MNGYKREGIAFLVQLMDSLGEYLLASPGFALQEDRDITDFGSFASKPQQREYLDGGRYEPKGLKRRPKFIIGGPGLHGILLTARSCRSGFTRGTSYRKYPCTE
jgi:hypothetical protein